LQQSDEILKLLHGKGHQSLLPSQQVSSRAVSYSHVAQLSRQPCSRLERMEKPLCRIQLRVT
jgi:hypothetical protein